MNYESGSMNTERRGEAGSLHSSSMRAFSLVETIVAIAILSIAVVAPLTLAQRGLNASIYARDQVTAFYLAQEAIEYVRNVRDTNYLAQSPVSWLAGLEKCVNQAGGCGIDATFPGTVAEQTIACASDPKGCLLTFNAMTGIYGERRDNSGNADTARGWKDALFTRRLVITPVTVNGDANGEADIVATVSWQTGSIPRSFSVNEKIFNWFRP